MESEKIEFTSVVSAAQNVHNFVAKEIINNCQKECTVIDLGAGEGKVLHLLQNEGYKNLFAIDGDIENFKLDNIKIQSHNLNIDLPFARESFDAVISSEVMEHMENPWHFTREIVRILKDEGVAVITTPNINSLLSRLGFLRKGTFRMFEEEHYNEWGHISPLSWFMLKKMFEKSGLKIVGHRYNTGTDFIGSGFQIFFQKIFFNIFKIFLRGEFGGDINIITLKKTTK